MIRTRKKKNVKWWAKNGCFSFSSEVRRFLPQWYLNHPPLFEHFFFITIPFMPIVRIAGQQRLLTL